MACNECVAVQKSYRENPFVPYSGNINDELHHCQSCGTNWFQYNRHFHLWSQVQNDAFQALLVGRDVTIDIATGSIVPGPAMSE